MPNDVFDPDGLKRSDTTTSLARNIYRRVPFMQGGRPVPVSEEVVTLLQDGTLTSDAGRSGRWITTDAAVQLAWDGAAAVETLCHYDRSVTTACAGHLFAYGAMLVPDIQEFDLPVPGIRDNPKEHLGDHLARVHPTCKRVLSRASQDYFDLFPKNGKYLEVGVAYGNNAKRIRDALDPQELHLVDCWEAIEGVSDAYSQANLDDAYAAAQDKFRDDPAAIFHKGLAQDMLSDMASGQFDMIYIDADHTEEACYRDLCMCEDLVKPTGFLCGHDYTRHANTADGAVARTNYGVIEAVDRFCRDHGWTMVALSIEVADWCFPSYVLTRST